MTISRIWCGERLTCAECGPIYVADSAECQWADAVGNPFACVPLVDVCSFVGACGVGVCAAECWYD